MSRKKLLALCIASAVSHMAAAQPAPQIEEISVIGQFVPDEKRSTDQISNVVNSEEFTRTGDSNIAESLKRVSGLSTVDGKFVYVRGLGERYSTTLLNGAILPSPEPINRVVPMDLFPTAVLESVLVQKTYSAQYPSEFGGGVLQMRTKKSTDEFFWNLSSSVGYEQDVTFLNGRTMPGGDTDWLGIDDGYRDQSDQLKQATGDGNKLVRFSRFTGIGFTQQELQDIGRSFRNEYLPEEVSLPANIDFSSSLGNFHGIGDGDMQLNYLASVDYSNSWDHNEIERNTWVPGPDGLNQQEGLVYEGTENNIDASVILTAGLDFNPSHNVRATSVLLRKTDDVVAHSSGFTESASDLDVTEIEWIERELFSNQIQGDHYFAELNELGVNWRVSRIRAERDSPDEREYRYDLGELSSRADGNLRRWSVLDDTAAEFGLDTSMVFYGPLSSTITTRAGYVNTEKQRDSEIRRFGFSFSGAVANDRTLLAKPIEAILLAENISPQGFEITEITRSTDNYTANSEMEAFYGEVEFNFDDRFRITLGGRHEDFQQETRTFDLFRPEIEVAADLKESNFLPALSATFIQHDHQFRLAYSETVSRPDFRELSTAPFTNPITGKDVIGNPDLEVTQIKNYDLRWEWYFGFSDFMSMGLFYKEFTNPIEAAIISPVIRTSTYINAESAENQGIEYEIYKRLDFLGGIGEDFYVQTNVAYIDSQVSIRPQDLGVLTSSSRPLQGQSDWLFNLQVGYEPYSGTTATLLYHYFGERIAEVGIERAPDLIEEPFGELNFIFIHDFTDHLQVTLKAQNLLDQRSEITQGGLVANGYNKGRVYSLKLDYTF